MWTYESNVTSFLHPLYFPEPKPKKIFFLRIYSKFSFSSPWNETLIGRRGKIIDICTLQILNAIFAFPLWICQLPPLLCFLCSNACPPTKRWLIVSVHGTVLVWQLTLPLLIIVAGRARETFKLAAAFSPYLSTRPIPLWHFCRPTIWALHG